MALPHFVFLGNSFFFRKLRYSWMLFLTAAWFFSSSGSVKAEPAGVDILGRPLKDRHAADGGPTSKRQLLDVLLEGYDLDKWPTFPDDNANNVTAEATVGHISVDIMFISSINVEAMDLTIDMYLNQKWQDKRLQFPATFSKRRLHLKTVEQMRRIWSPDTYIVNAKQANFHHITTENRVVYISGNGDVFYSARITAKVACEMKFHSFPMDSQECVLHLASYAYTIDILQMYWLKQGPVSYKKDMDLNQFHLTNVTTIECIDMYPDGGFPCLKIYFKFERRVAHHLIQTFLPTVLIVTISWVSFYIQADAVPARIALGITTLLTMITLNSGTKQGLPPVSYVKAIDVWMGVCTFFVFSAIWEYVIVCILERRPLGGCRHKPGTYSQRGSRSSSAGGLIIPNLHAAATSTHDLQHFDTAGRSLSLRSNRSIARLAAFHHVDLSQADRQPSNHNTSSWHRQSTSFPHPGVSPEDLAREREDQHQQPPTRTFWEPKPETGYGAIHVNNHRAHELQELANNHQSSAVLDDELAVLENKKKKLIKVNCACRSSQPAQSAAERAKRIDIIARFAYPLMFLLFNLFYWPYYLTMTPHSAIE